MLNDDLILPAHLRNVEHLKAFEEIWGERTSAIDTSELMMYMIDNVSQKAFPYLAIQFGIITMRDWKLATTDADKRDLLKKAIEKKATLGTVAAVKLAISILGFDPAHLVERCGTDPLHGWAQFKMAYSLSEIDRLDGDTAVLLMDLINDTKNARSEYIGLVSSMSLTDTFDPPTEDVALEIDLPPTDHMNVDGLYLDGTWTLDGTKLLTEGVENVKVEIH